MEYSVIQYHETYNIKLSHLRATPSATCSGISTPGSLIRRASARFACSGVVVGRGTTKWYRCLKVSTELGSHTVYTVAVPSQRRDAKHTMR